MIGACAWTANGATASQVMSAMPVPFIRVCLPWLDGRHRRDAAPTYSLRIGPGVGSLAGSFHGHVGPIEANLLVEAGDAVPGGTQHPCNAAVVTHRGPEHRAADSPALVLRGHDQHRDVAVGHAVGDGANEAQDLVAL